jgi:UDP-N-acetylglucosamine/UDP-N-acetylgalactosamine diphosphorylase
MLFSNTSRSHIITLQHLDQQAIVNHLESLPLEARHALEKQLASLDLAMLAKQRGMVIHPKVAAAEAFEPFDTAVLSGDKARKQTGQKEIAEGRVGCLLLAGGQGSRLGFPGPKGIFPISVIQNKSLFQLVAEKVVAASKQAGKPLPLAVMTSPQNDFITRAFFANHGLFGLDEGQLSFFCQGELPYLDAVGNLFLESSEKIAEGPNGNGFCFKHMAASGILSDWLARGIRHLNLIFIDNPLADPFDAELIGFHQMQGAEVTIKCAEKKDPGEKVGVLVKQKGMVRVSEYSEMPDTERQQRLPEGELNLETAVQDDKVMQDFELESLLMGGDHSQKVKAPPIRSDYGSKFYVNLSSSTAFSRLNAKAQRREEDKEY